VYTGAAGRLDALCLSGGGIRSAAFCLGVVQALAGAGLLARFHYLSTVSGGGYTGSLIWRLAARLGSAAAAEHVLADPKLSPPKDWLLNLRELTSFLAPRLGVASLDVWAAIAMYVRNTLVNWVLFLPAVVAVALLPRIVLRLIKITQGFAGNTGLPWSILMMAAALAGFACLTHAARHASKLLPGHQTAAGLAATTETEIVRNVTLWLCIWAVLATLWFALMPRAGDSVRSWFVYLIPIVSFLASITGYVWECSRAVAPVREMFAANRLRWCAAALLDALVLLAGIKLAIHCDITPVGLAILGPPWAVLAHLVHAASFMATRRETPLSWQDREWVARLSATEVMPAILWAGLATVCLWLSHVLLSMAEYAPTTATVVAAVSGPVAALLGRSSATTGSDTNPANQGWKWLPGLAALAASMIFATTLLMLSAAGGWRAASWVSNQTIGTSPWIDLILTLAIMILMSVCLFSLSLWIGRAINVNRFSLYELYRNRLVRAFLGSARPQRNEDPFTKFDDGDNMVLAEALPWHFVHGVPRGLRLFPVVNTALNLTAGTRTAWSERKAASFTMTPLFCGSAVLGADGVFVNTADFGGTKVQVPSGWPLSSLQLGSAMTISGAAVSPNAGYHTSPTTAFIMTLFNARLGAWMPNPAVVSAAELAASRPPNSFVALLSEMFGQTDDTSKAIYLSDGGHFDNLGIYEMLRRRCGVIVAIDADCDPHYEYFDLGNALRKARIDLGVEVTFDPIGPVPGLPPNQPCMQGRIAYPATGMLPAASGTLVFVKAHLPDTAPLDVLVYKKTSTTFPHETTGNQFFTESQFESYRRLGLHIAQ
jgi:hypothetical protein